MSERRFTEAEVASIFERAAESAPTSQRQLAASEGITLAEIQDIGRQVGITPAQIALAARDLTQNSSPAARTLLGIPIGTARTIELDRKLTDVEWERFVVDLRETFDARGTVRQEGSLRQWTNGNLQALLEPTATGHRIRLRTVKGDSSRLMLGGLTLLGISAAIYVATIATGAVVAEGSLSSVSIVAMLGVGLFGVGALRLPGWLRRRTEQMKALAERVTLMTSSPPVSSLSEPKQQD